MREFIRNHKKTLTICILISIGFIPFASLRGEIIPIDYQKQWEDFPYEYSQTGEDGYISVFPVYVFTNYKIHWGFECSDENRHILVALMDLDNYYLFEKLAFHRENGEIIYHEGNWLSQYSHHVVSEGEDTDEGVWQPPYLSWWCLVFYDIDNDNNAVGVSGSYYMGSEGIFTIINLDLSIILSCVYFASIITLFFLNRKYDLRSRLIRSMN